MNKYVPYIIGLLVLVLVILVVVNGNSVYQRKFDDRITLKHEQTIPYGTSVAKRLLPDIFPVSDIYTDNQQPGYWNSIVTTSYNQAVFLVADDFEAEHFELRKLIDFVEKGNYVFIIAKTFSGDTRRMFHFSYATEFLDQFMPEEDSLWMQLNTDYFSTSADYVFPGKKYDSWFTSIDNSFTHVLGRDRYGRTNFIRIDKGKGSIFIHAAPLAFSNYFILHKNNYEYFEKVLSVIPADINSVLWNDYFLSKPSQKEEENNWLSVLLRYESFKWGLLTAFLALLFYVVLGSRRNQRMIPDYQKPKNDSLDFVKTMGRLYHEKKDHRDLAKKMAIYFLEHIRTQYRLSTQNLDEDFVNKLHLKSGYPLELLTIIISFINRLHFVDAVNENDLASFHRQLESFYQKT